MGETEASIDRDYWEARYSGLECQDCGEEVGDHELDNEGQGVCSACEWEREEC